MCIHSHVNRTGGQINRAWERESHQSAKVKVLRLNGEPMEVHLPLDAKISDLPPGLGGGWLTWRIAAAMDL